MSGTIQLSKRIDLADALVAAILKLVEDGAFSFVHDKEYARLGEAVRAYQEAGEICNEDDNT